MHGRFENYIRPNRGWAAFPTHDELTLVVAGWPFADFATNKTDVARQLPTHLRARSRVRRADPLGPPGNSGYRHRRARLLPHTLRPRLGAGRRCRIQQGLHYRSRYRRRLQGCRTVCGRTRRSVVRRPLFRRRDGSTTSPVGTPTHCQCTSSPPSSRRLNLPPPQLQQLLTAIRGNQDAMDGFARVNSGVTSPADFFSDHNVGRIFANAH